MHKHYTCNTYLKSNRLVSWQHILAVCNTINDILIIGETFDDHLHNLRFVLQRLREADLKLKLFKYATYSATFWVILSLNMAQLLILLRQTKLSVGQPLYLQKQIQQFTGFICSIKRFATITTALYCLTEEITTFKRAIQC